MKNKFFKIALLFSLLQFLSSCSVIGSIFKTGMGVGIFIMIAITVIVIFFISQFTKK